MAGQFTLSQSQIQRVSSLGTREGEPAIDRMWQACVVASRPRLDTLAQRLEVKALSWDDLVLPREEKALLRQIMDQVGQRHHVYETWGFGRRMSRGLGISALFAGESGTGKTLAAEVIAGELQLNLYRIDLSQVVSKYIGETEKNLRKLFDAAEDGGSILFFDEADALFGKRSEVKDSHDRYANIEINYLLQRMDAYRGLAILATNMKSALDTAFMRRLRFVVNFPFPGSPRAATHLGARVSRTGPDRRVGLRATGAAQPHRRQYPEHRRQCRLPGRAGRQPHHDATDCRGGPRRVPKTRQAGQRGGLPHALPRRGDCMNVRLHIERLILDGLPLSEAGAPHVQAAIETELARLIAAGGVSADFAGDRIVPSLRGGDLRMSLGGGDADLGRQIAGALYGGIGK